MTAPATRRPELPLEAGTLLFGDLHLDVEHAPHAEGFARWLDALPPTPRLVVLGDFFEYWVGPAQAVTEGGRAVLDAIARATARGSAVDVVPGNRDFLLDRRFERATGATLRPEGFVGRTPDGGRVLVVHGDELCTLDVGYLRLRRVLRSAPLRFAGPRLPLWLSTRVARRLRRASTTALESKPRAEAEQQPDAARALARAEAAGALVCGHAHRWRDERLEDGPRWIVLDAFGGDRDVLRVEPDGALTPLASADLGPRA